MTRADLYLVENGFAASRAEAQAAIAAGTVQAGGKVVIKASQRIPQGTAITYARPHPYVSRGGVKLAAALDHFALSPAGRVCLDIGASTGGFTEVLLARAADKVYAVDVGHGQLRSKLRADARVVVLEGVNARDLGRAQVPDEVAAIVADVSFISLKLVLEPALRLACGGAWLVALVKPQFEAGREAIAKGGIVKDGAAREAAVCEVRDWLARQAGWSVLGIAESPISGGDGNREFLLAARKS